MESEKRQIIVPWDFSQVAENALKHAINYSKILNAEVSLLHVIKKDKEKADAEDKLNIVAEETEQKYNVRPKSVIKEGSIFTEITELSNEIDAAMIIMGTHGMKGMQKFTGSWALKVIVGTRSPFIVVQGPPQKDTIKTAVFPIDFRHENKQKLVWANYLVKNFGTEIKMCKPNSTDQLIVKKTNQNIYFAQNYMEKNGIKFDITTLPGEKSFADEVIDYTQEVSGDMILVMTTKNISFQDYMLGADEQKIIANGEKIPVMCINPRDDLRRKGGFA